jgi:gamma-glutamyltranspeptidase / glutathione hydrolase
LNQFTTRPEISGAFGVVTSTHWLASAAGMAILEKGGNAFDAAVATGFALQIVEPHLNGPAGDVPALIAPSGKPVQVICGQGVAPAAAAIKAYKDLGLDMVPGTGLLATVVPGAFDMWMVMLRDHGTLRLADVMAHALSFARDGYPMIPRIHNTILGVKELFATEWPSSAAIYLPGGAVPKSGALFTNLVVGDMYARIISEAEATGSDRDSEIEAARRIWREGFVAEAIDKFCRNTEVLDSSGRRHRGLLTGADMAAWEATYEDPTTYDYHGYTMCKTGPWGQGPVFLQQLALLKDFDLAAMGNTSAEFVHTVVEASKLAFADREAFYGDPNFGDVPMQTLLSDDYNQARARLIGPDASSSQNPGEIPSFGGKMFVRLAADDPGLASGAGEPTMARFDDHPTDSSGVTRGDTCHLDIIDKWGNMVAVTPSGGWLQSSPAIPGLGFCLNTRAQMFWLDENTPSKLEPGKRPRTTLSPSLCLRDGEPYMAFGTPGGDQQDQWSLHLFLQHVHFDLNLQEAIEAPGFHTNHFPSSFYPRLTNPASLFLEGRFPKETIAELKARGHIVSVEGDWDIGRTTAASQEGRLRKAAASPRHMQGYAIGR